MSTPLPERAAMSSAPREVINGAQAYGVEIKPVAVAPGGWYWQVVTCITSPEEMAATTISTWTSSTRRQRQQQPERRPRCGARVTWDGGVARDVDKPANEPGTNFPM